MKGSGMRFTVVALLVVVVVIALASCGGRGNDSTPIVYSSPTPAPTPTLPNMLGNWTIQFYNSSGTQVYSIALNISSQTASGVLSGSSSVMYYFGGVISHYTDAKTTNVSLHMDLNNDCFAITSLYGVTSDGKTITGLSITHNNGCLPFNSTDHWTATKQ